MERGGRVCYMAEGSCCSHLDEKLWLSHSAPNLAYSCSSSCCLLEPAWASNEKIGILGFSGVSTISFRELEEAGNFMSKVGDGRCDPPHLGS